jgi:hypothetical protein
VRRNAAPWERWTVTEQFAARVMVLRIRPAPEGVRRARSVAAHAGLLGIMMSSINGRWRLPPRRVQWSRGAGYVKTDFRQRFECHINEGPEHRAHRVGVLLPASIEGSSAGASSTAASPACRAARPSR